MAWPVNFETYQDVKANLALATTGILFVAALFVYWILPESQIRAIGSLRLPGWAKGVGIAVLLPAIALVLVYGIQLHDRVYDRYVVKWRDSYDIDFIIPAVCHPYEAKLDPNFYPVARSNRRFFMTNLYYQFLHDRNNPDFQNVIVRFYERVTNLWTVEIMEAIVYLLLMLTAVYFPLYRRLGLPVGKLVLLLLVFSLGLALTSALGRSAQQSTRDATQEEIDAIHQLRPQQLEKAIQDVSSHFNLKYG